MTAPGLNSTPGWNSTTDSTAPRMRRARRFGLTAALLVAAAGIGVALTGPASPSAVAAPDPCAASEVAKTVAEVATYTGNYLEANPEANQALTTISQQQDGPQSVVALKGYFDANPEVAADLQRLQQPLASLSGRCKLPATAPQLLGLMQAARQQSPALPAGLSSAAQGASELPGIGATSAQ
jgi:heme-binding protein